MRILHLTRDLPPAGKGGISPAVAGLLRASAAAGVEATAISFDGWRPKARADLAAAKQGHFEGLGVLRVYGPGDLPAAGRFAHEFEPTLLHVHDGLVWQAMAEQLSPARPPMVLSLHVAQAHMARLRGLDTPTLSQRAEAQALRDAHLVLAPSNAAARDLLAEGLAPPERVQVVGHGLDVDASAIVTADTDASRRSRTALYSGRFDVIKGTDVLLDAIQSIVARHAGARVCIAGGLPDNPKGARRWQRRWLQAAAQQSVDAVRWAGWLDAPALAEERKQAALLVVPSRYETFGLAALEGLAAGMAVVASDAGGLPELIEHDVNGLLVPPGDSAALARVVGDLLDDPQRRARLGSAAASRVRADHGWKRVLPGMLAAWRQAAG